MCNQGFGDLPNPLGYGVVHVSSKLKKWARRPTFLLSGPSCRESVAHAGGGSQVAGFGPIGPLGPVSGVHLRDDVAVTLGNDLALHLQARGELAGLHTE